MTYQDLYEMETHPKYSAKKGEPFDAALEEVLHYITNGYAATMPEAFAVSGKGSKLTAAMDKARGGSFKGAPPKKYPAGAWYSYSDETCTYNCQAVEYFYWALTSMLGGQKNRFGDIGHEWALVTRAKVEEKDKDIFALLTDK